MPPLYIVDAFSSEPFRGNPAAVTVLADEAEAAWMGAVAAEMNLSETAFPRPLADGRWELRWFTPAAEVELCGHATLASAHILWETERADPSQPLVFATRHRGELHCSRAANGTIEMDFPAEPATPKLAPPELLAAVGAAPVATARSRYDWLVELADEAAVRAVDPDLRRLATIDARGVMITAPGADGADHDFVSRFFAPALRVDEDPVTGSAHCVLAPYWAEHLGRTRMIGYQASRRGGRVEVEVRDDRVILGGRAVTVLAGSLHT